MIIPRGRELEQVRDTSPSALHTPTWILAAFLTLFYSLVSTFSSAVVVHTEVFRKRLILNYGVKPSKVFVIPHGIEANGQFSKLFPQSKAEPRPILYFGVISPRKGLETLLSAFAQVSRKRSDCQLWLAGSSPPYYRGYKSQLQQLGRELDLDGKARFLGPVSGDFAHVLFNEASFVVLPYYYSLSASGALSWALAHGRPVIASETDYFKEELSQTRFGLLVPPNDPARLAEAMETLLAQQELRETLSSNARLMGFARSWEVIAGLTLDFYENLANGNDGS
jgi:glycosyltransferase involved in cell wall biosynthesis